MSNDFQPSTLKFILLMAALRESSLENPKNSNDLIRDVETAYMELCPDEPVKSIAPATIIRHIKTINKNFSAWPFPPVITIRLWYAPTQHRPVCELQINRIKCRMLF